MIHTLGLIYFSIFCTWHNILWVKRIFTTLCSCKVYMYISFNDFSLSKWYINPLLVVKMSSLLSYWWLFRSLIFDQYRIFHIDELPLICLDYSILEVLILFQLLIFSSIFFLGNLVWSLCSNVVLTGIALDIALNQYL